MGILGRRIGVRISKRLEDWEARPAVRARDEHDLAVHELTDTLRTVAGTGATDAEACAAVRQRLPEDPEMIVATAHRLAGGRTSYLDDRAYRLLTAAVASAPVRPIDPRVRDRFEAERKLGRCTLTGAFDRLAAIEPRLRPDIVEAWDEYEQSRRATSAGRRLPRGRRRRPCLTGLHAEGADPLLHTALASAVVTEYAIVTRGGQREDADPTPFFERERHTDQSRAFGFEDDTRPRACN